MEVRPNGRKQAIDFVWGLSNDALTTSQKDSISAALADKTDETASLYFLAPVPEQWVDCFETASQPLLCLEELLLAFCEYSACLCPYLASERMHCKILAPSVA